MKSAKTQYVCVWTVAIWAPDPDTAEKTARNLSAALQNLHSDSDYPSTELLQSQIVGPFLCPRNYE